MFPVKRPAHLRAFARICRRRSASRAGYIRNAGEVRPGGRKPRESEVVKKCSNGRKIAVNLFLLALNLSVFVEIRRNSSAAPGGRASVFERPKKPPRDRARLRRSRRGDAEPLASIVMAEPTPTTPECRTPGRRAAYMRATRLRGRSEAISASALHFRL